LGAGVLRLIRFGWLAQQRPAFDLGGTCCP
jgi:hypothetical protein